MFSLKNVIFGTTNSKCSARVEESIEIAAAAADDDVNERRELFVFVSMKKYEPSELDAEVRRDAAAGMNVDAECFD